jgi:hypothetical protein
VVDAEQRIIGFLDEVDISEIYVQAAGRADSAAPAAPA